MDALALPVLLEDNQCKDEEIFLEVAAKERFRILKILNDRPYLLAEIADYSDCTKEIIYNQKIEDDFRTQVLEFIKNVVSINGGWIKDPKLPEDFNEFVWYVSSFLQISNKTNFASDFCLNYNMLFAYDYSLTIH